MKNQRLTIYSIVVFAVCASLFAGANPKSRLSRGAFEEFPAKEAKMEITRGENPGQSSIFKFGTNEGVTNVQEDIWSFGGDYEFYPTTAQTIECVSDDVDDNSTGTGARLIRVLGLDENWLEQEEFFVPTGLTDVTLTNTYLRLFRMLVITAGATEFNEGEIICDIAGGGDVAAVISPLAGGTQMAIFTVPGDKTAIFTNGSFSSGRGNDMKVTIFARSNVPGVFPNGAWVTGLTAEVYQDDFVLPDNSMGEVPGRTDVRFAAFKATGGSPVAVSASFIMYMFDT